MTRKEALEYLKHRFMETGSPLNPSWESLEELKRHYGAIGIAISALEQQVPKQPDLEGDGYDEDGEIIFDEWLCPCCRTRYEVDYDDYKFCPNCGLDCEGCDARIATVGNDNELREKTARKWSEMNNAPEITAATINCMGCRVDGAKFAYCSDYCEIRK